MSCHYCYLDWLGQIQDMRPSFCHFAWITKIRTNTIHSIKSWIIHTFSMARAAVCFRKVISVFIDSITGAIKAIMVGCLNLILMRSPKRLSNKSRIRFTVVGSGDLFNFLPPGRKLSLTLPTTTSMKTHAAKTCPFLPSYALSFQKYPIKLYLRSIPTPIRRP